MDDWGLEGGLNDRQRRDLVEILYDRDATRSTIVTSQLPVESWPETLGDPTVVDAILDRLVHNDHRIELEGHPMRKNKGKTASSCANEEKVMGQFVTAIGETTNL